MSVPSPYDSTRRESAAPPIIRRHRSSPDHGDLSSDAVGALSDSLVDQVVERIERRVIEELERRGRRQGRGGF